MTDTWEILSSVNWGQGGTGILPTLLGGNGRYPFPPQIRMIDTYENIIFSWTTYLVEMKISVPKFITGLQIWGSQGEDRPPPQAPIRSAGKIEAYLQKHSYTNLQKSSLFFLELNIREIVSSYFITQTKMQYRHLIRETCCQDVGCIINGYLFPNVTQKNDKMTFTQRLVWVNTLILDQKRISRTISIETCPSKLVCGVSINSAVNCSSTNVQT